VEGMYGVEVFFDEAMNIAFPSAYQAAIEASGMNPVDRPQVEVTTVTAEGFTFKATFPNYPEAKLGQYKGLNAEKPSATVTDEDVEGKLKEMADRNARLVSVEREAQNGDTAVIDFEGKKDGVPFDGGKGENYPLELGSGTFIPGFEEQIVGMKPGEEKDIDVTFPEDYQSADLAGQPVVFTIKLHEVKEKDLPAMDDEFAKDVSEFDTLEEFKADLRKKEEESREASAKRAYENALLDQVADNLDCDVPDAMVESQARQSLENYKMQVQSQGMPFDAYLQMTGMREEDLLDSAREPALHQLRITLALEAIIKEENLTASEEEIEAEYQKMADQYNMKLEDVKKYLRSADVEEQIRREKALDIIVENATVKEPEAKDEAE
jgi:trigger factor